MWIALIQAALAQSVVTVQAGESACDAIRGARTGTEIRVEPGATTDGRALIVGETDIRIVGTAAEPSEICAIQLRGGAEIDLENVVIPTRTFGQASIPSTYRSLFITGGTVTGRDVTFAQSAPGHFGLLMTVGRFEVDGLRASGFANAHPVVVSVSGHEGQGRRELTLRDCELSDNAFGVVSFRGEAGVQDSLQLDGCTIVRNSSPSNPIVDAVQVHTVRIAQTAFVDNDSPVGTAYQRGTSERFDVDSSVFCGGSALPFVKVEVARAGAVHRSVFQKAGASGGPMISTISAFPQIVHDTFVGGDQALSFGTAEPALIANSIFADVGRVGGAETTRGSVGTNLVFRSDAAMLDALGGAAVEADPAFIDAFLPGSCAALPLLSQASPAIDAGEPLDDFQAPAEDADAPDLGAYPFLAADPDPDPDPGDPSPPDERWLTGGGCASLTSSGVGTVSLLGSLLGLRRRRRRPQTGAGPDPRALGPNPVS